MIFDGEFGIALSSVLSIIFGGGLVLTTPILAKIVQNQKISSKGFDDPTYIQTYGTITEGLNTKTMIGLFWNVFILMRWVYTTLVLIFARDYCEIQI